MEGGWSFLQDDATAGHLAVMIHAHCRAPDPSAHKEWIAVKDDEDSQIQAAVVSHQ
jgi:hypothetical protein